MSTKLWKYHILFSSQQDLTFIDLFSRQGGQREAGQTLSQHRQTLHFPTLPLPPTVISCFDRKWTIWVALFSATSLDTTFKAFYWIVLHPSGFKSSRKVPHPLTRSTTNSLTHSAAHPLTRSPTHSLCTHTVGVFSRTDIP